MKREEAIELYLKTHSKARQTIDRLIKYEPDMTIREYSNKIGVSITCALFFLNKNGVVRNRRQGHALYSKRVQQKYASLWDSSKTILENSKVIKKPYYYAQLIANKYGFKYSHHTRTKEKVAKRVQRVVDLMGRGLKQAEVARVFNVSREYIRQLVHTAKVYGIKPKKVAV